MCAPCKIILDSGVAAVAKKTARMVEKGLLTDDQMNELSRLDELWLAAVPKIIRDHKSAHEVLTSLLPATKY